MNHIPDSRAILAGKARTRAEQAETVARQAYRNDPELFQYAIAEMKRERELAARLSAYRWEVQRRDGPRGWDTWVTYDEQHHADAECARRIDESPDRDKRNWRVVKRPL